MCLSLHHINRLSRAIKMVVICFMVQWPIQKVVYGSETGVLSGDVTTRIECTNSVQVGDAVQWTLTVVNTSSSSRTNISQLTIYSFNDLYGGSGSDTNQVYEIVDRKVNTNSMSAGQTNIFQTSLVASSYTGLLTHANSFKGEAIVQTEYPTQDVWLGETITEINISSSSSFLSVSPASISTGQLVTATVNYTNIAPLTLNNFNVFICFEGGLTTNGVFTTYEFNIGTVTQNQCVVVSTNGIASSSGTNAVTASVEAMQMQAVHERKNVMVQ